MLLPEVCTVVNNEAKMGLFAGFVTGQVAYKTFLDDHDE
jgi:hypothetical protein